MNIEQAKSVRIEEFLHSLNISPERKYGNNYWYKAPYREDNHPSFKVNTAKNTWFDVSVGSGGDIIRLAQVMYSTDIPGALEAIAKVDPIPLNLSNFNKQNESVITIRKVQMLQRRALINYVMERGIPLNIALKYLQEAYYQVGKSKQFFALAFKNDIGGYELRNKYFKGGSSPKGISTFSRGYKEVAIFEGFFDFLTAETYQKIHVLDIVVLNSASMVQRAIPILKKYTKCYYFGDNDKTGDFLLKEITSEQIPIKDCRYLYIGFKDLNEKFSITNLV